MFLCNDQFPFPHFQRFEYIYFGGFFLSWLKISEKNPNCKLLSTLSNVPFMCSMKKVLDIISNCKLQNGLLYCLSCIFLSFFNIKKFYFWILAHDQIPNTRSENTISANEGVKKHEIKKKNNKIIYAVRLLIWFIILSFDRSISCL